MGKHAEFIEDLSMYWHCEGRDQHAVAELRRALSDERHPISTEAFQQLLCEAIRVRNFSVNEYELVTGMAFDSSDDVADDLKLLQDELFVKKV